MTSAQHDLDRFFSGSTDEKIEAMEDIFRHSGTRLLEMTAVRDSLERITGQVAALEEQMAVMDLGTLCGRCAARQGGGCCSSYMEANSDVILLLMNRLQGTTVQRQHDPSSECCFLGATGCSLPIKPMFCLNYNCSHIHKQAGPKKMACLEQLAGTLLTEQTRLEAIILGRL